MRWSTIAAVTAVAAVAGWVSYEHALAVVRAHGEAGAVAQVYPITVDGLIYSASMVLLDAARRGARAPGLARWLLGLGIAATLAANVTAGLHFGPVGAIVAAWPAVALVGSYELLMLIIRSGSKNLGGNSVIPPESAQAAPISAPVPDVPAVPETVSRSAAAEYGLAAIDGHAAEAERLFAAELEEGKVPAVRRIRDGLHVGQPRATEVQAHLRTLVSRLGHVPVTAHAPGGRRPPWGSPRGCP